MDEAAGTQPPTAAQKLICENNDAFYNSEMDQTQIAKRSLALPQEACWRSDDLFHDSANGTKQNPRFEIVTPGLPPVSNSKALKSYGYIPQTIGYGQIFAIPSNYFTFKANSDSQTDAKLKTTAAGVKKFAMVWGNRCSPVQNPAISKNPKDPNGCQINPPRHNDLKTARFTISTDGSLGGARADYNFFFTTYAKADACTKAQTLATIGAPQAKILSVLASHNVGIAINGLSRDLLAAADLLKTESQREAFFGSVAGGSPNFKEYEDPANFNDGIYVADVCYVPMLPADAQGHGAGPYADAAGYVSGILFDWEVNDHRDSQLTANFFSDLTAQVHQVNSSIKMIMANDPVTAAGANSGLDSVSGPVLANALDAIEIFVQQPGVGGINCMFDRPWVQLKNQMIAFGFQNPDDPSLTPAFFSKFMVGFSMGGGYNQSAALRKTMLQKGFVYIQPQTPDIRQYSCDVSNTTNGNSRTQTKTQIVRHLKDLLHLPTPNLPELKEPVAKINADLLIVPHGQSTTVNWFVQNPTSPTGVVQAGNCHLVGPRGDSVVATYGTLSTGAVNSDQTYTLTCDDLTQPSQTISNSVVVKPSIL